MRITQAAILFLKALSDAGYAPVERTSLIRGAVLMLKSLARVGIVSTETVGAYNSAGEAIEILKGEYGK